MSLTRYTVGSEQTAGGISVRTSPDDPEMVEIRLFDGDGADLPEGDQRKIERIYFREDYRRAGPGKLGELEFPPRAIERYTSGLLRSVDAEAVRRRAPKVVVDYAFGPSSLIGPSILGRLGCDVLSVNAFIDENRPVLTSGDLERMLDELSKHVRNSGSDLGVLIDPGGEFAYLVDDRGHEVSTERTLLAFLRHQASTSGGTVAVPVSCSWVCEEIAAESGASLLRTTTGLPSLMARARRPDVTFAGNAEGVFIFPSHMPTPDALMTFCKALEMLATTPTTLSALIEALPPVHIVTQEVRTPWDQKGAVMRHVASVAAPGRLVLLDGVKIIENDRWALVIPAPDEPKCFIWAEGPTRHDAEELAARYASVVEDVVARSEASG